MEIYKQQVENLNKQIDLYKEDLKKEKDKNRGFSENESIAKKIKNNPRLQEGR
ncbi:hypothetical protein MAL01_07235 [Leptospira noguchii]|uniref:hypothetical protein n=1 Tax=Leptospira noguchii TaxID=28182 RepID=UPI001FB6FAC6|nr:hypothetical protein [Leptospira noguchii]UOG35449.1 hypothetical protein MAL02_07090 [Leptospira noguchii]UOG46368.1 hypothetical protein MAL01_07235 [Leptospira noguchii]